MKDMINGYGHLKLAKSGEKCVTMVRAAKVVSTLRRDRYGQCRSFVAAACLAVVVFWASYSTRCFLSQSVQVEVVLREEYCKDGTKFLDPLCANSFDLKGRRSSEQPALVADVAPVLPTSLGVAKSDLAAAALLPTSLGVLHGVVDSGMLYTSMDEYDGRRSHFEALAKDVGYFHAVRFDSACPSCSKTDGKILSHIRILQRISFEMHTSYVLVFEDDIELAKQVSRDSFVTTLHDEIKHVMQPNDDIAYLGVCLSSDMEKACNARKCRPFGTFAYMITPRGARTVMRKVESKYGKHHMDGYVGKSADINDLLGPAPVLGWNYTHDYVANGWRGLFYQSRKPKWRLPAAANASTLKVTVTHTPKDDMLGSFLTPSYAMLAIARRHGWKLEIMPYLGSRQERTMIDNIAKGDKMESDSGGALVDASNRQGYDPVQINAASYDTMGFFPPVRNASFFAEREWLHLEEIPQVGVELADECRRHEATYRHQNVCNIMLPDSPWAMEGHMKRNGGYQAFFTPAFGDEMRTIFLAKNKHRLQHFAEKGYHVAIHLRRGDILVNSFRWVEQSVYAAVARHICASHAHTHIHVFSAGKNPDGNWTVMEQLTQGNSSKCATVSFHLDEDEFDTWTHMVVADALVMSKSNFALIPSLLAEGDVYYPHEYWHFCMPHFLVFDSVTGKILKDKNSTT